MPMGIDSFSFDLFGVTRRAKPTGRHQSGDRRPPADAPDAKTDTPAEHARDQEHFFWGMFLVL